MNKYLYLTLLISFLFAQKITAQLILPDFQCHKVVGDEVLLKWEPRSTEEWLASKTSGYIIEKYVVKDDGQEVLQFKEKVFPSSISLWEDAILSKEEFYQDFVRSAMYLVHPESDTNDEINFDGVFEFEQDELREARMKLGLLSYTSVYDFEISTLAGLGFRSEIGNELCKFKVSVYGFDSFDFIVDPSLKENTTLPVLSGEWSNQLVELKWKTRDSRNEIYGYYIEKSSDGLTFIRTSEVPIVNVFDSIPDEPKLHYATYKDSLDANYITYYYRLRGLDYFGNISEGYSQLQGQGFKPLGMSPIIEHADQTEDNYAEFQWTMPEKIAGLVKHYNIKVSDSISGPYAMDMELISPQLRSAKVPMKFAKNYYVIEAVPVRGKPVTSTPVFVMGQDTIPPAQPQGLAGEIDSFGAVTITWNQNYEQDLWGYRVFKSNFESQEFSLLNASPTLDTLMIDSLDLKFATSYILYKIVAVDKRNNRSEWSDVLRVEKPDINPPSLARVIKITTSNDTAFVHFHPSPSKDVVVHQLFRRDVREQNTWTLIHTMDSLSLISPFVDTNLEAGKTYAYTMQATDNSKLKSKASPPGFVTIKSKKRSFDPAIEISYDIIESEESVQIKWKLSEPERLQNVLIYRGFNKKDMARYKIIQDGSMAFSDKKGSNDKIYYYIKPYYFGQEKEYRSEVLEVDFNNIIKTERGE